MINKQKVLLFISITFVIASFIFFLIPYLVTKTSIGWSYGEETGVIGDTIGGIVGPTVGFVGAILTFLAFYIQYQANQVQIRALNEQKISTKEQKKQMLLQQFESNFFVMINLHRQNVSELNYTKFDNGSSKTGVHRKVFRTIFREFIECFREVKGFSNSKNPNDYLIPVYRSELSEIINDNNIKNDSNNIEINLIELAIIDIAYSIVFYGINKESEPILRQRFKKRYNPSYFFPLLQYIKLKPKQENTHRWDIWLELRKYKGKELRTIIQEFYEYKRVTRKNRPFTPLSAKTRFLDYDEEFNKYYGGHLHRLGHYFRHLFQCYKYLNYHRDLSENEKYFYGKTLRAQLSNYEQAILFVNSISTLGMKWELTPEVEFLSESEVKSKSKLITRFNLIKNLPDYHLSGLKYKKYYPNVKYEADE
ncbi:MAG TPA: putative phage abortive infection protein [Pyrinomonadaceae bacterium]|jgi:hypothetical protein